MNFTVYKSSAGSGKTYTLVKEYLKISLQDNIPDNYRKILAITFTNKATSEMKDRVLSALKALSSAEILSGTNLFLKNDLVDALGISEEELRKRAHSTLTHILHHYSDFSISTIDKFVCKVVRTFARDLRIPMNFEVELDAENLLRTAIDILISKAGTGPLLTRILVEFTERKAEDGKSWKIENDLFDFSEEMLKEECLVFAEKLKETDLQQFFRIKEELRKQTGEFEDTVKKSGKEALALIEQAGVSPDDFAGGQNGIAKFFYYLSVCRTDKFSPSKTIRKYITEDKWYAGKITPEGRAGINTIKNDLAERYFRVLEFLETNSPRYFLLKLILQNIYSLAVLRELEMILDEIKAERNVVHISEFNKKIASIVTRESAPFIYERLGEKFRHFLVDEFQDTSSLQWMNLLPLIHNSLSEGNFNMVVGDGKQAIYRWRSGDVEQFAKLPAVINPENSELLAEREMALRANFEPKVLEKNFRSKKEIVEFNNCFFKELSLKLNENFRGIYDSAGQDFNPENTGGLVRVEVLRESLFPDLRSMNMQRTLEIIHESRQSNFELKDICILCRRNADASEMAAFLMENRIDVISSESLLLSQSAEVNFLVSFICFLNNPSDKKHQSDIIIYLVRKKGNTENLHSHLSSLQKDDSVLLFLKNSGFEINLGRLKSLSVYELTEELVRIFSLQSPADPYVSFFLEQVHSFTSGKAGNITGFPEFWENKKNSCSVIVPDGLNAVRIMTIHKAKGLEFPVVIFPFANWQEIPSRDYLWINIPWNIHGLPSAIVGMRKDLEQTCFADKYREEKSKSQLDNFNILYVAFTRAKERLYVISSIEKMKNFSGNFIDILQKHSGWDEERFLLQVTSDAAQPGKEAAKEKTGTENPSEQEINSSCQIRELISADWREKVHIRSRAEKYSGIDDQKNYGKNLHLALSMIKSYDDAEPALEKLFVSGVCSRNDKNDISEKIKKLLGHPEIRPFFEPGLNIKNEEEILLPNGETLRPDRIIFFENKTAIIDYKTGAPLEKHKEQVAKYAESIGQMGYKNIEQYLLYTGELKLLKI